ncbi:hypothetical protein BKA62DRAFT_810670 [Auriculariales sp. MPI-PUGE-AT-0066]|nr:hypothetical protein BKA62DRAFT_810670 [Auriculariales sp. MPI-PUGE-AT-0066]
MPQCKFCSRIFKTCGGLFSHLTQDDQCKSRQEAVLKALASEQAARFTKIQPALYNQESESDCSSQASGDGFEHLRSPHHDDYFDIDYSPVASPLLAQRKQARSLRVTITDVPEENGDDVVDEHGTAATMRQKRRRTPMDCDYADFVGKSGFGPFPTEADWKLASWAKLESVSDSAISRLLKIQAAHADSLTIKSARDINRLIDKLPSPAEFQHEKLCVDGQPIPFDCFHRNALEIVRDLIGDPTFAGQLLFKPVRRWTSKARKTRKFSEWNTGNWAWEIQLPTGATVVPIILSTDKTELTTFTGKQTCYPVYMTVGNIPKHLRRQPSTRAWRLLAYLPTGKIICKPLFGPAKSGEVMIDSEGVVRTYHPVLAAYAADYPEQCLITCTRYGQACPVCDVLVEDFDKNEAGEPRHQGDTLATIEHARTLSAKDRDATLQAAGLNNVPDPFWKEWPHANVHAAMASDVLHQLVQGMGKHLVEWIIELVDDEDELDARFQRLPRATGLRHFRDGITILSNVSGQEHKAIYAQLIGCIHGLVPDDAVRAACALLDFIYIAQYECHSEDTLNSLSTSLSNFHEFKDVFQQHGIRADFKLPKLHACQHYVQSIRRFGTIDNYNTECTERLHIELAKHAYQATNKRDYEEQMCRWLQRREAILRFHTYLAWKPSNRLAHLQKHTGHKHSLPPPMFLAKRPHRQHVTMKDLQRQLPGLDFKKSMADFLRRYHCLPRWRGFETALPPSIASTLDRLSHVATWNHVKFTTPNVETLASKDSKSVAYASFLRSQYDPVLLRIAGEDIAGAAGINDLRVGRLRAIVRIPDQFACDLFAGRADAPDQLAVVDLYTRLPRQEDDINGMFLIQKPTQCEAAVVPIDNLRRAAHLFPRFGSAKVDRKLTSNTILDAFTAFYLNNRVDKDAYRTICRVVDDDDGDDDEDES